MLLSLTVTCRSFFPSISPSSLSSLSFLSLSFLSLSLFSLSLSLTYICGYERECVCLCVCLSLSFIVSCHYFFIHSLFWCVCLCLSLSLCNSFFRFFFLCDCTFLSYIFPFSLPLFMSGVIIYLTVLPFLSLVLPFTDSLLPLSLYLPVPLFIVVYLSFSRFFCSF